MRMNELDNNQKEYYKDFIEAQSKINPLKKTNKGYEYYFADLKDTLVELKRVLKNIGFIQYVETKENGAVLITKLIHKNGYCETYEYPIRESKITKTNDVQSFGGCVTYSKRYALQAIFGIPTEDEDGRNNKNEKYNLKPVRTSDVDYRTYKLPDGKYEGKTVLEITDREYLEQLIKYDKTPVGLKKLAELQIN